MITEIQELLDKYIQWLKDRSVLRQINDWVEITTPYLDRHNDYLQIYVKRDKSGYILSDDSYIIEDLRQQGCELETKKRKDLLIITLNGFGVKLDEDALMIRATADSFALRKHNLVQAMLAINDLFYLAEPIVVSLFLEDVTSWLIENEIRFTPNVKFTGKSGYDHLFHFVIPSSKRQPERIIHAINKPNKDTAQSFSFAWIDTKAIRPIDSKAYAFLNDTDHTPLANVIDALRNYDVKPIIWSEREKAQEELKL